MPASRLKRFACRYAIVLITTFTLPFAWAQEFGERYPNLPGAVVYGYDYWGSLDNRLREKSPELEAPGRAIELIMEYYQVPENLREKLFTRVVASFGQNYLIQVGVWGANDAAEFPREFAAHGAIARKNCAVVAQQFDAYCATLSEIARSQPQAIINLKSELVIPVPAAVKAQQVREPAFNIENLDWVSKKNISSFDDLYIAAGSNAPGLFEKMQLSLAGGISSRRCFTGNYGFADVNADGFEDLLVVGGRADDSMFDWQLVNKTYAYARVYVVAIDFSQGVAKPLFQDELFAYEMDYKGQAEGTGEGIVREARFYWGDFDRDGDADYLVRRLQADVSINWGLSEPTWQTGAATVEAILYEGTASGYEKSSAGGDAFLQYVGEHTDWNQGFPDPHNCL